MDVTQNGAAGQDGTAGVNGDFVPGVDGTSGGPGSVGGAASATASSSDSANTARATGGNGGDGGGGGRGEIDYSDGDAFIGNGSVRAGLRGAVLNDLFFGRSGVGDGRDRRLQTRAHHAQL